MATPTTINIDAISDYFLYKAKEDKKPLTNKKLQKLLYYSQAWSLVIRNKKLFKDKIEAWVHGPAIKSIYIKYKKFGYNPIVEDIDIGNLAKIPADVKNLLEEIWKVYGKLDAEYLELLTHSEAPWQEAREGLQSHDNSEKEILLDTMKDFYSKKLESAKKLS